MTDLPIEVAGEADLAALHALIEAAYRGDSARRGWTHEADLLDGQRTDMEALAAIVDDPRQRMLVARQPSRLVGCIQLTLRNGGVGYLGLLAVDPDIQANGLGARLLAAAETCLATQLGASTVEMTVIRQRVELIAYYQRRGYVLTGEIRHLPPGLGQLRDDITLLVMAKVLPPSA